MAEAATATLEGAAHRYIGVPSCGRLHAAMSSSAQTMITFLSELDQAIAIVAQVGKDDASSESSAQALLHLREEIAEQAKIHGEDSLDKVKLNQVGQDLFFCHGRQRQSEMQ